MAFLSHPRATLCYKSNLSNGQILLVLQASPCVREAMVIQNPTQSFALIAIIGSTPLIAIRGHKYDFIIIQDFFFYASDQRPFPWISGKRKGSRKHCLGSCQPAIFQVQIYRLIQPWFLALVLYLKNFLKKQ